MDEEQQHVAAEAPAEAGEAATVTVPAETGPASEATPGQVKVEAGSKADSKAPLEKTEASEGLPPVEAAVKEEPRRFETAAAADEPMPGPSPEAHCGAADTAVKGPTACSNAEPASASSPVKDEQRQPSSAPSPPATHADARESQDTLPKSEAAQPSQAEGPSLASVSAESDRAAIGKPPLQKQPEDEVDIAPIPAANRQPRLPNGRFLPKGKKRPESAPAARTRESGRADLGMEEMAAVHANGALAPLEPHDAAPQLLPLSQQQIPLTQKSVEGRKRHSMPALACQLPSRRSTRGVKAQHGETHGSEQQNDTELGSKADGAAPAPMEATILATNKDAQPAPGTSANAAPDTAYCPDSGPAHSELPLENSVQQLRCALPSRNAHLQRFIDVLHRAN